MSFRSARALAALLTLAPALVTAVTAALWAPRLPEVLPVQWSSSGVTTTAPTLVLVAIAGITALAAAAVGASAIGSSRTTREMRDARGGAAGSAGAGGVVTAVWVCLAALSLDEPVLRIESVGGWPLLALAIGVAWAITPVLVMSGARATIDEPVA